jgi:cation-transporting ATPase 13A1
VSSSLFVPQALVTLLHVLSQLAQHWSMRVRVAMRYTSASALDASGCVLLITPPEHQGKPELVPVQAFTRADASQGLFFMFQRQRYELEADTDTAASEPTFAAKQLPYPVAQPLREYLSARGLKAGDGVDAPGTLRSRFGRNEFNVPVPTLRQLYVEQLLGPVTQFQLFSALLWVMDEYWKYALFHTGMIFMFEGTTAFGRLRSLQTLRGMGHKSRAMHALRSGAWVPISSDELLPGDIISLTKTSSDDDCIVPCDCLILTGAAVANEATLTGESVPQMKEAVRADTSAAGAVALDIAGEHRIHILYSGTTLMQHAGQHGESGAASSVRPPPPDGGIVCFVLRTGFASSQGALMRMIEFSQEQVTGDSRETLVLLLILLVFALLSAGHVLRTGLAEGKRSQYELLLRCVFILTTVVPPELPMQTALAVNTSLMALHKAGVFCTEPYRIPLAGKVDSCLFDKTGTLTTDKLVAQGVVCFDGDAAAAPAAGAASGAQPARELASVERASLDMCLVLAGCHSLLEIDGKILGDPIEVAALQAIDWVYTPGNATAAPGAKRTAAERPWKSTVKPSVKILHRYHFSSALQRMSVLARVAGVAGGDATWGLVKGSPEAIAALLEVKPSGYDATYRFLAERGMRVLALAAKAMPPPAAGAWDATPREAVESALRFVGFVAFSCRVRNDTSAIVARLSAGGTQVSMVTGDAALTALFVAREVGICNRKAAPETPLLLTTAEESKDKDSGAAGALQWVSARLNGKGVEVHRIAFDAAAVAALSEKHDLVVTGPALRAATAADATFWAHMKRVRVFARMSPEDKEAVLKALRAHGGHTLMCGDGANDVGALKQAHVGLALLSGFGDANTKKAGPAELAAMAAAAEAAGDEDAARAARAAAAAKTAEAAKKVAELKALQEKWTEEVKKNRAELVELQKKYLEEELENFKNVSMGPFKAMRAASGRLMAETRRRNAERLARYGGSPFAMQAGTMAGMMEGLEDGELPRVKLGDASIAAPFTSKAPSICSTVDIIRQGRCALVNTAQQQQILALNCLISAYSLSALYLDGIKSGEAQMIATGILLTVASLAFSFARPVEELSPVAPLRSIFHPAYALSLVGQLLIHLTCMVYSFQLAKEFEPAGPGSCTACGPAGGVTLSNGTGFIAELSRQIEAELAKNEAADPTAPAGTGYKFTPSLLNTVVFLVTTAQQVSVMFVNYKGRPFMQGITENPAFMWSILLCAVGAFVCAFERMPELNAALKLVSMPNDDFRWSVLRTLAISTIGAFVWDRICLAVFAPHVLRAALNAAWPDPMALMHTTRRTFLFAATGLIVIGSGAKLIVLIVVYQLYKFGLYS